MTSRRHTTTRPSDPLSLSSPYPCTGRCLQREEIPVVPRTPIAANLESIARYYSYARGRNGACAEDLNGCFAVRLALFLIEFIGTGARRLGADGSFTKAFYRSCADRASEAGLCDEAGDDGLLVIYIKQCLHILQAGGMLIHGDGYAALSPERCAAAGIYFRLFHSFWNIIPWETIFPSDAESARELQEGRSFLKDTLLRHRGEFRLDRVANEFFELTGFSAENDLFTISFIDFYPFTWLRHFGILRYAAGAPLAPVRIVLTEAGRKILQSFR